jgi:hypothetical protein
MDAQGHARFRRLPRLAPARRYCAPKNPLCNFRVPQNCEELRGYIEDVRLMERVREGEWRSFQPLLDLVESGVWQWREDLHSPMLSQLFRLSGTVFSPGGIYVCPQVIENVTCIAPREPAVLSRYMNTIVAHYLVPDHKREALCFLSRLVVWPIWDWNEETHKPILDSLAHSTCHEGQFSKTLYQASRQASAVETKQDQASRPQMTKDKDLQTKVHQPPLWQHHTQTTS